MLSMHYSDLATIGQKSWKIVWWNWTMKQSSLMNLEIGTAYVKENFLNQKLNRVFHESVTNPNKKVWVGEPRIFQYFERLDKVRWQEIIHWILKRKFTGKRADKGPVLTAITDNEKNSAWRYHDLRIIIRTDRDMGMYIWRIYRAAGFEPINQLSGTNGNQDWDIMKVRRFGWHFLFNGSQRELMFWIRYSRIPKQVNSQMEFKHPKYVRSWICR